MPPGPSDAYILWTEHGLACRLTRNLDGWQVSIEAERGSPFLRRFAQSRGDAGNQAEYLRVLLDRSRAGRPRERQPLVLIVEDDPENLFAYEELVQRSAAGRPAKRDSRGAPAGVTRARCPLCGIAGALVDGGGCFHCQQCGQDGTPGRELYVDSQN